MAFKISVSDPEEGKAWQVEKEATPLIGTAIGEEFNGSLIGLEDYTLKVTGGSDEEGFPMRRGVQGTGRRKVLMKGGSGYRSEEEGTKKRRSVRGESISEEIVQVNTKVVDRESDAEEIPELLGVASEEPEEGGEEEGTEEEEEESGGEEDQEPEKEE
ncbi:MAG: 30S ribosomal protein S6e [Candidatus Aenigmatarchaeota archaeon]